MDKEKQEGTAGTTPPAKSKRDTALERLQARHPDKSFDDDEAMYGQILDDADAREQELGGYKDREKTFSNLFTSDPRSAKFLTEWSKGKNPVIALVENFGSDFVEELKDPDKQKEIEQASKDFADRLAKSKQYDEEYDKNIEESKAMIAQLHEDGISEEDTDRALDFINGIMTDAILGKVTKESIYMALDALDHDKDVAAAEEEGKVQGKNTKINMKLRKRESGDGTANLSGKNSGGGQRRNPETEGMGYGATSIFERGGEKRIHRGS